jgi:glutaminyl-tRNA synthetase
MGRIGVAKTDSMVDIALLEYCLREDLNKKALRVMAALNPLKLIIENWKEGAFEDLQAVNNPEDERAGTRNIRFGRELWIEREDFAEVPPPKYFRLFPGNFVRLRYGYVVKCTGFDKDAGGAITAVRGVYDPATKGGNAPDNRKVRGTIHWVNAADAVPVEVRLYGYLFRCERPMEVEPGKTFKDNLDADSLEVIETAYAERSLLEARPGQSYQFERQGYFVRDPDTGKDGRPVFNKTIGLRDTWKKIASQSAS